MRHIVISLLLLFGWAQVDAQILTPVKWNFEQKSLGNNEYELQFIANIDKGWTVYSQFTNDEGPVPTSIEYDNAEIVELIGQGVESGKKKEGFDKIFQLDVIKFLADEPFIITQKVKLKDGSKPLTGYLTYMTCDKEKCLPPTDVDFSFDLKAAKANTEKTEEEYIEELEGENAATPAAAPNATETKMLDPVKWDYALEKLSDSEYNLVYTANIDKGWTVYSQFTDDDGPVPTSINFEASEGIELIGKAVESGEKKEGFDKIFQLDVIKFLADKPFVIKQKIKVNDASKSIKGYLTYMTCDKEKCLPPVDLDFAFDIVKGTAGIAAPLEGAVKMKLNGDVLDQKVPKLYETYQEPIGDCGTVEKNNSLFWMFLLGMAGGLLALLTPCVFPMIPLTVSFFTKDTRRSGWMNGAIYGASIIVIYVALGLLLTALFGEEALNRLSTNWIANTIFFLIFLAFAFSFFGFFEITLPSSWSTKTDGMADKGGLLGIFFMAFTLALVSFSCTGPIIGSAIVQAASNQVGPAVVMFGFALALALPFGLFAAFPSWLNTLPKSGSWMNSVKVVLGFLELALAFKFLSVADMTNHWGFLKYEVFMAIWVLCFLGMALYLFGFIKFPHDSPIKKLSPTRWVFALASLAFTIYLATGFFYNDKTKSYDPVSLMSGLAPPSHYNFLLDKPEVDKKMKERFSSYSKCANNIDCFKDYYQGMSYAREQGKPALIDMTGHGCVNCRKTEEHIWIKDRIRDKLNNDFVLISLYVDDDEKLDKKYTSARDGNPSIRNVGNMWADFQIVNFEQNSQPLYIMVTPDEEVLASPRGYQSGVESYDDYLDCGLKAFEQSKNLLGSNE